MCPRGNISKIAISKGNVDFIFGDAMAFFERCEIHGLAHSTVMFTAQSKHYAEEKSGYVFDHCRLNGGSRREEQFTSAGRGAPTRRWSS